ncbi:hypothetical protein [Mangrovicoccus sp. HB161399]|uniref:hypothetical protein n=1 Tax=Mangrovicoccus sp. HB161399 TaxID=2720392 RepID=UPI0015575138|nr:hypothetical protein [Mangrovicoccus sp. HB161399]
MSEKQTFLSDSQQKKLAEALDRKFDLPLVRGKSERKAWVKFVIAIDIIITSKVQNEYLDALNDPAFQLEDMAADILKENLAPILADLLSVPILPYSLKLKMIGLVLELLIKAMAGTTTIDEVAEEFLKSA